MTASVIYSLIPAFLSGLGYFIFRYYSENALWQARCIARYTFWTTGVTKTKYKLLIEIMDEPDMFEGHNIVAGKKWTYSNYLKAWTENKALILDIFTHNDRMLLQYYFADLLVKLFWPILILLFIAPEWIPMFLVGFLVLPLFYYPIELYQFYFGNTGHFLLCHRIAHSINDFAEGKLTRFLTHSFFTKKYWIEFGKSWWVALNSPQPETKD